MSINTVKNFGVVLDDRFHLEIVCVFTDQHVSNHHEIKFNVYIIEAIKLIDIYILKIKWKIDDKMPLLTMLGKWKIMQFYGLRISISIIRRSLFFSSLNVCEITLNVCHLTWKSTSKFKYFCIEVWPFEGQRPNICFCKGTLISEESRLVYLYENNLFVLSNTVY